MTETIHLIQQGYAAWPIILASDHPTAKLAARELADYMLRISDRRVPILPSRDGVQGPCIELFYEEQGSDGFVRQTSSSGIQIAGRSPRGLLFAIYDLLEELGCRWYGPGPRGERVPKMIGIGLPTGIKDEEPYLPGRCLVLRHATHIQDAEAWIDWAAKNRYNALWFRVPTDRREARAYERAWGRQRKRIGQLAHDRSMTLEYGGDILARVIPARFFWRNRRAFRFDGQRRHSDQPCASSPEGMQWLHDRAARLFHANEQVDGWHIWSADRDPSAWCDCPDCRRMSPSDQALLLTNIMADALAEVNANATISFAARGATAPIPLAQLPRGNVMPLVWAGQRCFAHAVDDPNCAHNRIAWSTLPPMSSWFALHTHTPATVLERYLDGPYFDGLAPVLANVLPADIQAYRQAGYERIAVQVDQAQPWLTAPLSGYVFANTSWQPRQPVMEIFADIAQGYYGGPDSEFVPYLVELETAFQLLLDLLPEESAPRPLDFHNAPLETRRAKLAALLEARKHLDQARDHLKAASRPGVGWKPRGRVTRQEILEGEQQRLELAQLMFAFYYQRQLTSCLIGEKAARREIAKALQEATQAYRHVETWGKRHLGKPWAAPLARIYGHWRAQLLRCRRDGLVRIKPLRAYWTWRARRIDQL